MQRVRGFSLIELMVAIAIGSLMLALLAIVYSRSSWARLELDKVTRVMENARFAVDVIGDDVRHAGFYGGVSPPSDAEYVDASPCAATFGVPGDFGWRTPPLSAKVEVPSPVLGFNNATGAISFINATGGNVNLNCLQSRADGADVLAIRRVSSLVTPVASLSASSVYVQPAQCATEQTPSSRRATPPQRST